MKRKQDGFGYNEYAFKSMLAMAGYDYTGEEIGAICEIAKSNAYYKLATGAFTRRDVALIQYKLGATPEQICKAFFTGKEAVFVPRKRRSTYDRSRAENYVKK